MGHASITTTAEYYTTVTDDHANHVVTTYHVDSDGLDDAAGVSVAQDEARGGDVERQPEERRDEQ